MTQYKNLYISTPHRAFVNNSSANINLSKTQLSKRVQLGASKLKNI